MLGEYLPDVRTLDREDKRKALALSTSPTSSSVPLRKDYSLSEKLVAELGETAKD
jgi:hypothetical protein